jgi:membrane dipeptidase
VSTHDQTRLDCARAHIQVARDKALALLQPTKAQLEHGQELHRASIVVDSYGFTAHAIPACMQSVVEKAAAAGATHHEIQRLIHNLMVTGVVTDEDARAEFNAAIDASGVTCVVQNAGEGRNLQESLERMSLFTHVCDELPNVVKAVSARQIEQAAKDRCHCLFLSLNNPIMDQRWDFWESELHWLSVFKQAGIRIMHLTYNRRNRCGDGCAEPANAGLSDFGRDVIGRMNELGLIVDVAHSGQRTSQEAALASAKPIVASHSGVMALNEHARNKTDDVIRAICDGGGYVGVCAIPPFLGRSRDIVAMLDHIQDLRDRFGADHVAIGCDATYLPDLPPRVSAIQKKLNPKRSFWSHWPPNDPLFEPGAEDDCRTGSLCWTNWPLFTVGLVQRGFSDEDIRKVIGGNCLRVMRAVEDARNE